MSLSFHRNPDGTTTGRNNDTGFTFTDVDPNEVERCVYENAGWEYSPPPPPTPAGYHRFTLEGDALGSSDFAAGSYAELCESPPVGCVPENWGHLALRCQRPGDTLLDAVAGTVAEVRRDHGLVMNSLGIEKPDEWIGGEKDGYAGQIVAHLFLGAVHRARLLGYGREDLVRLLDATGIE
ncbi:hypothetical protein [Streptomyces justiciae]|uniref:hypothetical protein n=1 Tax=Streptomyces justiciae TaxID=2780140 RepID=UPI002117861D|nr:hypothetical protein [Streptomyces justiciae]MCW8383092.1 hypothetical protein [Streptomyces justiciae]